MKGVAYCLYEKAPQNTRREALKKQNNQYNDTHLIYY